MLSPGHTVHGLLVDWRYHEADGGHHRLVSRAVQDIPLEGLGVVEERALVSFMDSDLKRNPQHTLKRALLRFCDRYGHSGL